MTGPGGPGVGAAPGGGGSWEWLERADRSTGAPTHAHLHLWSQRLGEGVYDLDVGEQEFDRALARAAARGYTAEARQYKAYHVRDLALCLGAGQAEARVQRTRLLEAHELPGAPLLATLRITDVLPFSAFPCGQAPHEVRYVRALRLRVHPRAHLVFEAHRAPDAEAVVRTVHLEVALARAGAGTKAAADGGASASASASADARLRACVEAAVHSVLLGLGAQAAAAAAATGSGSARPRRRVAAAAAAQRVPPP